MNTTILEIVPIILNGLLCAGIFTYLMERLRTEFSELKFYTRHKIDEVLVEIKSINDHLNTQLDRQKKLDRKEEFESIVAERIKNIIPHNITREKYKNEWSNLIKDHMTNSEAAKFLGITPHQLIHLAKNKNNKWNPVPVHRASNGFRYYKKDEIGKFKETRETNKNNEKA